MRGIVYDGNRHWLADDVSVREPGPDEVRVRMVAAGLCHSDLSVVDGTIPYPTPVVLGHEGAGVVEAVGAEVKALAEGDRVVLSTLGSCGHCSACERGRPTHCRASFGNPGTPFRIGDRDAFQFANTSVFADATVVQASQAVPIGDDVPMDLACLVGCGVVTGVGAVLQRARVAAGQSVAVIGAGGIGLNVIQGARIAGALPIVAVDTNPAREALARQLGATHFVCAKGDEADDALHALCPNGVDFAFECVGSTQLVRQAIDWLDWGGTAVILGVGPAGAEASFAPQGLYHDKTIMGCRYGAARPHHDFPMLLDLYRAGRLELEPLVTRRYALDDYATAFEDLERGELARGVLTL